MSTPDSLLPAPLSARAVRSYINFDGGDGVCLDGSAQSRLQSRGVAALWHLISTKGFAYLGDEVGMGKTRQAMGVIATQFLADPDAHVVIVCPGRPLQEQWLREWDAFIVNCYKPNDNRLRSALDGRPIHRPELHDRLRDFARALLLNEGRIHLLRYSSFSRPIWFGSIGPEPKAQDVFAEYGRSLREIGVAEPSSDERQVLASHCDATDESWLAEMTARLNEKYAMRVGQLIQARKIDLLVCDEAQYLRHLDNRQNTNLRHVFRTHVKRWLFMSATPLHSGLHDIGSLDAYFCDHAPVERRSDHCPACARRQQCPRAAERLQSRGAALPNVVGLLEEFLVRRPRTYQDAALRHYGKVEYRKYERRKVSAGHDPFLALTMALVQKRLVRALAGRNNRFRQGECSSFESLSTSLKRSHMDHDGVTKPTPEIERTAAGRIEQGDETPDRSAIDTLNASFRQAIFAMRRDTSDCEATRYSMPHAKLHDAAERLFQRSLRNGDTHKTLVFVRRLDTVDELLGLLLAKFQAEVDRRLDLWRQALAAYQLREPRWSEGAFWSSRSRDDDREVDAEVQQGDAADANPDDGSLAGRAGTLPYFEALKRKSTSQSGKSAVNGMLVSFHGRLLQAKNIQDNPLRGFLLVAPEDENGLPEQAQTLWRLAEAYWIRFVDLLFATDPAAAAVWKLGEQSERDERFWRIATLKRCLLQSFRQTDFLVDLYVLNRFLSHGGVERREDPLPEKLLWFLGDGRVQALPADLETYVANWKAKLRLWFDHFDLIVDKCLRGDGAAAWAVLFGNVDDLFARMSPAFGRSGRLNVGNAVAQFKLPVHPNVLVCTDVLKEGVDLHLFCDEVVHYGVAWTSGDLEQRIGRVDRVGSLVGRRIGRHAGTDGGNPRLHVEFPYLHGTLDEHQVARVIVDKIRSDLRLDLGKREEEIGSVSLSDLETAGEALTVGDPSAPRVREFYPEGVPDDEDGGSGVVAADLRLTEPAIAQLLVLVRAPQGTGSFQHLPMLDALRVRCNVPAVSEHPLLRRIGLVRRRRTLVEQEEYLVSLEAWRQVALLPAVGPALREALASAAPVGVRELAGARSFSFDRLRRTLACEVLIANPFATENSRRQLVLLERVADFWLLRTPVFSVARESESVARGDWPKWIADANASRDDKWGYFALEQGIVWFVAFVRQIGADPMTAFVECVAERIGKIADRLQHLHALANDEELWDYRSRTAFPTPQPESAETPFAYKDLNSIAMDNDSLKRCGQFLAQLQTWFAASFEEVLTALYGGSREDSDEPPWKLSPVAVLENGVLALRTEDRERFRLQAFLQLSAINRDAADVFACPRIIWELAVSPNKAGQKPLLELSDWSQLPHSAFDGWEGDGAGSGQCAAYTYKGEKYRYLVVYHHPMVAEAIRQALLDAWGEVLGRMQSANFQKSACRALFAAATTAVSDPLG